MWPNLELAWSAASGSTRARIAVSTPNPDNPRNFFWKLRERANVLTLKYYLHPNKQGDWAEREKQRTTEDEFAHEVDISYEITRSGMVYPNWKTLVKIGDYPFVEGRELFTSWDFGVRDTSILWIQRDRESGNIYVIDAYQGHDQPIDFYVPFITGTIKAGWPHQYDQREMKKITEHGQWGVPINYGDPAGNQRSQTDAKSPISALQDNGVYIGVNYKENTFTSRKRLTEQGFRKLHVDAARCSQLDMAMLNSRYPERREGSQATSEIARPVHDEHSHMRTALEYFFVNVPQIHAFERPATQHVARSYSTFRRRRR
jgi:hypothetical protein